MPRRQLLFVVPQKVTKKGTKGGGHSHLRASGRAPLESPSQHHILCGGKYESPCHFVTSPFRQGGQGDEIFLRLGCFWQNSWTAKGSLFEGAVSEAD